MGEEKAGAGGKLKETYVGGKDVDDDLSGKSHGKFGLSVLEGVRGETDGTLYTQFRLSGLRRRERKGGADVLHQKKIGKGAPATLFPARRRK